MESRVRDLLFEPLRRGVLSAIVPDFTVVFGNRTLSAPAQLSRDEDAFEFSMHFMETQPPEELRRSRGGVFTEADRITVHGQIGAEIAFRCTDVFPPSEMTTRSRGTSTVKLRSSRMELVAEGTDTLPADELHRLLGSPEGPNEKGKSFHAHLIYHGPKLNMFESGTQTVSKNDFLGEATKSSTDTHQFSGDAWQGGLIQKEAELHLHLRSIPDSGIVKDEETVTSLVDHVNQAVGFTLGFQPWPAYRELRIDHRIIERWLSPRFDLATSYLVPISGSMWSKLREDAHNPVRRMIPTIAGGLERMAGDNRNRLTMLLWHFRSGTLTVLPSSTRLLILCAVLDGLMKLIAGVRDPAEKPATNKTWRKASDTLGLSWDRWTNDVFELWGKHRHLLTHGWLWLGEAGDVKEFFADYPRLGCAFLTLVAAYCGYDGPILADPFQSRISSIGDLKDKKS